MRRWRAIYGREYGVATHALLRGTGLVHALWFWSYAAQAPGLAGPGGLLPSAELLAGWRAHLGAVAPLLHPTLLWFSADNTMLLALCGAGALAGFLLLCGVAPFWSALVAGLCQLSLRQGAPLWLNAPGDALLGEISFCLLFLASPAWPILPPPPDLPHRPAGLLLIRAVLFKFLLGAGLAKLASPAWHDGIALHHWFETQPLPTAGSAFFHFLPSPLLDRILWAWMFIELALPFYLLLPRSFRLLAAGGVSLHALLLLAAGNSGFLPLLELVLAASLPDDSCWRRWLPEGWGPGPSSAPVLPRTPWPLWLLLLPPLLLPRLAPPPWRPLATALLRLGAISTYELHTHVPVRRFDISIQGSPDGRTWREYPLRQRPSDPRLLPPGAAPHHPRLDEQLALAARPNTPPPPWLLTLGRTLLADNPSVTALFAANPFPDTPPRFLRLVRYEYRLADASTRRQHPDLRWIRAPRDLLFTLRSTPP